MTENQVLMPALDISIERKFTPGLTLISAHEFDTDIAAMEKLENDAARPVVLTVPGATKFVYVAIKGVAMWFGEKELVQSPVSTFRYEIQEGVLANNQFKFVIRGIFSDRLATLPWGAAFRVGVLCFG